MPFLNKIILILLISLFICQEAYSQESLLFPFDTTQKLNSLMLGSEKLQNTYNFTGLANLFAETSFGTIRLNHTYTGNSLGSVTDQQFNENHNLNFEYSLPLSSLFSLIARQKWIYYSIKAPYVYNDWLNRYDGIGGLRMSDNKSFTVEAGLGLESIKQTGIRSSGSLFSARANLDNYDLFDFTLNSNLIGEYRKLESDRVYSDFNYGLNVKKVYDNRNYIEGSMSYVTLRNEDVSFMSDTAGRYMVIASNLRNIFNAGLNINFALTDFISGRTLLSLRNGSVNSKFKEPLEKFDITKIGKTRNDLQFDLSGELSFETSTFSQTAGMSFSSSEEHNIVNSNFTLSQDKENEFRRIESLSDKTYNQTKFFTRSQWLPSKKDSLKLFYNVSIVRTDYPNPEVNNDNDFFSSLVVSSYSHRFSDHFTGSVAAYADFSHFVNLKASNSAFNKWRRIISLSPSFYLENKTYSLNPQFFITAMYDVYDFNKQGHLTNESRRDIGYKDSLFFIIKKNFNLQTRINVSYYEKGKLYWDTFSESPYMKGYELFAKSLLFYSPTDKLSVGSGFRYYNLFGSGSIFFGPETLISYIMDNNSLVTFEGRLEISNYNQKLQMNPNLNLVTKYNF